MSRVEGAPAQGKRRSRRLRKKLRVGEFRELGFELALHFHAGDASIDASEPDGSDAFWHAFIVDCVEARGLAFGGANTGYVTRAGRGSATVEDQDAMRAWLTQRPEIASCEIGPLEDAWHPPKKTTQEETTA